MKNLLIYSVGLLFLSTLEAYSQTTFYSQFSGNWTDTDIWNSEPNGTGTTRTEPSNSPWGDPGINFVIQSGHELTLNGRTQAKNLEVLENGKLSRGNGVLTYVEIFGEEVLIEGQLGNGEENDGISLDIGGEICNILGGGMIDLQRLRKNDGPVVPLTELIISTDLTLRYSSSVNNTALFNGGLGVNEFKVTIAEGATVSVLGKNGDPGSVSIDGPDGTNGSPQFSFGTFTINGTLDISGDLYVVTDNPGISNIKYQVNGVLRVGGKIIGNEGVGGDALGRLVVGASGELVLEGESHIFQALDPGRNEIVLEEGSLITYAGSASQHIYEGMNYQVLSVSGEGDKILNGDVRIEEKLELISGNIITGGEFALIINSTDPQAIDGGDEDSYVVGNLRRKVTGEGSYFFPHWRRRNHRRL